MSLADTTECLGMDYLVPWVSNTAFYLFMEYMCVAMCVKEIKSTWIKLHEGILDITKV